MLTNVSTLGEIHLMDRAVVSPFNDEIDTVMFSNAVAYREPETYSESLQCAEREERKALHARGVMSVVPTPVEVKPIKSR